MGIIQGQGPLGRCQKGKTVARPAGRYEVDPSQIQVLSNLFLQDTPSPKFVKAGILVNGPGSRV